MVAAWSDDSKYQSYIENLHDHVFFPNRMTILYSLFYRLNFVTQQLKSRAESWVKGCDEGGWRDIFAGTTMQKLLQIKNCNGPTRCNGPRDYSTRHNTKNRRFLWITFPFLWLRIQILQQFFYKDPGSGAILTHKTCHRWIMRGWSMHRVLALEILKPR